MTNAAVPSSLLPIESHTHRPPPSSPLSYHIVIIYPHSYDSLFFMPPFISLHYTLLSLFFNSLSIPTVLHLPLTLSVPQGGSAIDNFHMIVINGFDLFARLALSLSPPPSFLRSPRHSLTLDVFSTAARSQVALPSSLAKSNQSVI